MKFVGRLAGAATLALAFMTVGPAAVGAQETTDPDSAAMAEERAARRAEGRAEMTDEERAERRAERLATRDTTGLAERQAERVARRGERPAVGPGRSFEERWASMLERREDLDAAGARALAVERLAFAWERGSDRIDETLARGDVAAACGDHAARYRTERTRLEQALTGGASTDLDAVRAPLEAMSATLAGCAELAPGHDRSAVSGEEREAMRASRERGEAVARGQRGEREDVDPRRMLRRQAGMLEMLAERSQAMEAVISQHFGG